MRRLGSYNEGKLLSAEMLRRLLQDAVNKPDVAEVCEEVSPFVRDYHTTDVWSHKFFADIVQL